MGKGNPLLVTGSAQLLSGLSCLNRNQNLPNDLAYSGEGRSMEVMPEEIHQRCPVVLGSRNEVRRLMKDYQGD